MSLIPSPDQRRLNSTIEALREDKRQLQDENKRLRDALKALMTNPSIDLGDMIYNVKDREGKGWEGPDVTAWGKALIEARKLLEP